MNREYVSYQRRTLAATSLWLLEPAMVTLSRPRSDWRLAPMAKAAAVTSLVSFAHGWWGGWRLHMMDLVAARAYFVALMALFPRQRWAGVVVAAAYVAMRHATRRNIVTRMPTIIGYHPELQCRFHLLFRYLGYWWVRVCFHEDVKPITFRGWFSTSMLQLASAMILLDTLPREMKTPHTRSDRHEKKKR